MHKPLIALFFCVLYFTELSYSISNLDFEKLNSNKGLSSDEIRDIFQDREGYLWFVTKEGLNRYDGYDFKLFTKGTHNLNFISSSFECITEDLKSNLWVGTTEKGIQIFDPKTNTVQTFTEFTKGLHLDDNHIRCLLPDSIGNMWIGTEYGLYKYNFKHNQLNHYNLHNLDNKEPEWCIIENMTIDKDGNIWIATWFDGLYVFDRKKDQFIYYMMFDANKYTEHYDQIKSVFQDNYGYIWVGTWEDGLYMCEYNNGDLKIKKSYIYDPNNPQSISGNIIYSINQDYNNNIWIGTPYGLTIIEGAYSQKPYFNRFSYSFGSNKGISNNELWKIYRDKSGLMWLGTLEGGVNKVHPGGQFFESYTIPLVSSQIQSQTIQAFTTDKSGNLLIGVKSLGFGIYRLNKKEYIPYYNTEIYKELPGNLNTVNCFLNTTNKLWLGTRYYGVLLFDYQKKSYISLNETLEDFPQSEVHCFFLDSNDKMWVGTDLGLYYIDLSNKEVKNISQHKIYSIIEDADNNIWVGSAENGIIRLNKESKGNYNLTLYNKNHNNIYAEEIQHLFIDSKKKLWVGTSNKGLLYYNIEEDTFKPSEIVIGSNINAVMGITEDRYNNLWLTTNNGVIRITFSNNKYKTDKYSITDGLQGKVYIRNSIFQLNGNQIFMGGYYGFNAFFPNKIRQNNYLTKTVINEIRINNKPTDIDLVKHNNLRFKHFENNIEISFSSLSYYKSDKNLFSYILEGYHQEWQYSDASERWVKFPKLEAGTYHFKVKSANSSELWNPELAELKFEVLPSPLKTWWAYSIYTIIILSILIIINRMIIKNERMKKALEIEKIEHAKTENINQFKFQFFTNISHELLTPLSIMTCATEIVKQKTRKGKDELGIIERNIDQLRLLLNQLLDFRKMESGHIKLKVKRDNLSQFLESLINNFKPYTESRNLTLKFENKSSINLCYYDEDKLNKILHNLISNAIKYTPRGGMILIHFNTIKSENKTIATISVSDTGVGIAENDLDTIFERFYRTELKKDESGTGIGLSVTKNLVELHRGSIKVNSELNKGTKFIINIPVHASAYTNNELTPIDLNYSKNAEESELNRQNTDHVTKANKNIKILIIEDNNDFRKILSNYFSNIFLTLHAKNAEQGIKKALNEKPNVIISDVMMPGTNGFELCRILKNNDETKQIPIILLTAKTTDQDKALGYEAGADSYITKPVSLPVLESRISSLILKKHQQVVNIESSHKIDSLNPKLSDEEFLRKLKQHMIKNLSETDFQVTNMHLDFGMSNTMFYRQVKKLTKKSPIEYLKMVRLNKALQLLKKGQLNISEVAYNCGFSDQSYFGVCFKKQFGMTPSEFCSKKNK